MIFQRYQNLQNVNADNMNTFYQGKTSELIGYFPYNPAICSGIGYSSNNYGQVGTSNTFNFADGLFRFVDQPLPLPDPTDNFQVFAEFEADILVIALGVSPGDQYAVAKLAFATLDNFKVETSSTILLTTMTLAEIAADPNPEYFLVLFKLSESVGVYTITIDDNCAWNYNGNDRTIDFPSVDNPNIQEYTVQAIDPTAPNSYAWLQLLKTYDTGSIAVTNDCRLESITDAAAGTKGTVETYTDNLGNPLSAIYINKNNLRYGAVFCNLDPTGTFSITQFDWRDAGGILHKGSTRTNPVMMLNDFAASDDTVDTAYVDIPTPLGNYRIFTDIISVTFVANLATFVMPFSISIRGVQACSNDTTINTNIIAANWSGTTITLRADVDGLINVNLSVVGYV